MKLRFGLNVSHCCNLVKSWKPTTRPDWLFEETGKTNDGTGSNLSNNDGEGGNVSVEELGNESGNQSGNGSGINSSNESGIEGDQSGNEGDESSRKAAKIWPSR